MSARQWFKGDEAPIVGTWRAHYADYDMGTIRSRVEEIIAERDHLLDEVRRFKRSGDHLRLFRAEERVTRSSRARRRWIREEFAERERRFCPCTCPTIPSHQTVVA